MTEFARAMQIEIDDYNLENGSDQDTDLLAIGRGLDRAITANDADEATRWAREGHRYLVANGYTDADELPSDLNRVGDIASPAPIW